VLHPVFTVPSPVPALFAYAVYVHAAMLQLLQVTVAQFVGLLHAFCEPVHARLLLLL